MKAYIIYIVAAIMLIAGLSFAFCGLAMANFSLDGLSTEAPYAERVYTSSEAVTSLTVVDINAHIELCTSTDDSFRVTCMENDRNTYTITTDGNGALTVNKHVSGRWFNLSLNFGTQTLKIEIPREFAGNLSVKNNNGKIIVDSVSGNNLLIDGDNQNITVSDVRLTGNADIETDNGRITVTESEIRGSLTCDSDNGGVDISNVSAQSIGVDVSNGKIRLDTVSAEARIALESKNGNITLERVEFGADLECESDNGSVTGSVKGALGDFSFDCKSSNGSCNLPTSIIGGSRRIAIKTKNGSINISFTE